MLPVTSDLSPNSEGDAPFPCTTYDSSRVDCGGIRDYLRDVPWENIFKPDVSAAASLELMYTSLVSLR